MRTSIKERVSAVFRNTEEYKAFAKEWNKMRKMYDNVKWVKEYEPGVRVVNK